MVARATDCLVGPVQANPQDLALARLSASKVIQYQPACVRKDTDRGTNSTFRRPFETARIA